jgi:hypothetical protein
MQTEVYTFASEQLAFAHWRVYKAGGPFTLLRWCCKPRGWMLCVPRPRVLGGEDGGQRHEVSQKVRLAWLDVCALARMSLLFLRTGRPISALTLLQVLQVPHLLDLAEHGQLRRCGRLRLLSQPLQGR